MILETPAFMRGEYVMYDIYEPNTLVGPVKYFFAKLGNEALIVTIIFHVMLTTILYLVFALFKYMFTFFALPLIVTSKLPACQALWLSFKAFNKNWLAITMFGFWYLIVAVIFFAFSFLPFYVLQVLGLIPSITLTMIALLFLMVLHIIIEFNATKSVFWYKAVEIAKNKDKV